MLLSLSLNLAQAIAVVPVPINGSYTILFSFAYMFSNFSHNSLEYVALLRLQEPSLFGASMKLYTFS
jgi:hypothetical protein